MTTVRAHVSFLALFAAYVVALAAWGIVLAVLAAGGYLYEAVGGAVASLWKALAHARDTAETHR